MGIGTNTILPRIPRLTLKQQLRRVCSCIRKNSDCSVNLALIAGLELKVLRWIFDTQILFSVSCTPSGILYFIHGTFYSPAKPCVLNQRFRLFTTLHDLQTGHDTCVLVQRGDVTAYALRRAFATVNAVTLSPDALQTLMQHKSYQTTQRYINMAKQLNRSVAGLSVPPIAGRGSASG